jgi:uncharacterized membrane protein YhhN
MLLIIAAGTAVLDWLTLLFKWKRLGYLTKPGVILTLVVWLSSNVGLKFPLAWFPLALTCSLIGDILLMLPNERFLGGLIAFLLGHLAYILGFNPSLPPWNLATLLLALAFGLTSWRLYRRISKSVKSSLRLPLKIYTAALAAMALSAGLTLVRQEWAPAPALTVSIGALLFLLSDSILAWDRFVARVPHSQLIVRISYHLGQFCLAIGVAAQYISPFPL